jgi:antitoxin component YwqK of YwqJK toxin-antitoxin module
VHGAVHGLPPISTVRRGNHTVARHVMRVEKRIEDENGENEWPTENFSGVWEIYWRSGGLKFRGTYIEGKGEGEHVCWWENGEVAQRGLVVQGRCDGIWTDFDDEGNKTLQGRYGPDGKEGLWCAYWANGQAMHEESWKAGRKDGKHRSFDPDGTLLYEGEFREGEPYSGICEVLTWDRSDGYHYLAEFQEGREIRRVPNNR